MIELQSLWIAEEFSTGDAIARDEVWDLMGRIWELLPIADTPYKPGVADAHYTREKLEELSSDYEQLERLFFGDARSAYDGKLSEFDLPAFAGCAVWELHRVDARKKLMLADQFRKSRLEKSRNEPLPPEMSPSPQAETPTPTPLLTSSTDSDSSESPYSTNLMPTPSTG
ncbi:MAG: hypothetical protein HC812_19120 [Leptolyngbya sp. RL_3_1]|nr:hypothetical protein [Leptolyngbya sp. RL_3_1]